MKGPLPSPEKYVDQSYLRQALKELGLRKFRDDCQTLEL